MPEHNIQQEFGLSLRENKLFPPANPSQSCHFRGQEIIAVPIFWV